MIRVAMAPQKPRVFVLVVGETARAANFSLLGYARATTPELASLDVTAFRNVTSCGTSTEVSVPCMFSQCGREDYDERRIRNSEGLLNVLARAGYAVKWLDNQSGCKGVCQGAGIEYRKMDANSAPDLCAGDECHDGVLVRALQAELANVTRRHGHRAAHDGQSRTGVFPALSSRVPPFHARLRHGGAAHTARASRWSTPMTTPSLYTDHVLAGVDRHASRTRRRFDTAMLYVSDHGESLGENGLYLHGLPYSIAPDTQTHVPMIAWLSPAFAADSVVDRRCVRGKAGDRAVARQPVPLRAGPARRADPRL